MPAVHRPATQSPEVQAAALGMLGILRLGDRAVGERRPPRSECSAHRGSAIARWRAWAAALGMLGILRLGDRAGGGPGPPRSECSAYCGSAIARLASVSRHARNARHTAARRSRGWRAWAAALR